MPRKGKEAPLPILGGLIKPHDDEEEVIDEKESIPASGRRSLMPIEKVWDRDR